MNVSGIGQKDKADFDYDNKQLSEYPCYLGIAKRLQVAFLMTSASSDYR
jgi:hypothetical protein